MLLLVVYALVWLLAAAANALAFALLWGWYVTPFFGGPEMNLLLAFGLTLLARFTLVDEKGENYKPDASTAFAMLFVRPFIIIGLGWLGTLFL